MEKVADKFTTMLQQVADGLGMAVTYAWPAVVRYTWAQAVATCLAFLLFVLVSGVATVKLTNWLRSVWPTRDTNGRLSDGDENAQICIVIGDVVLIGLNFVLWCVAVGNWCYWGPIILAPEGATIIRLLNAASGSK